MKTDLSRRLTDWLTRMPARQLHLLLGGALAVVLALLWTVGVRAPLAQLRLQQAEKTRMALVANDPAQLARQLAGLGAQIAALESFLDSQAGGARGAKTASEAPEPAQVQLRLIGAVEQAAARHGVQLRGAVPVAARTVAGFKEVSVSIEATGSYQALMAWMADADSASLAVVSFALDPGESAAARVVKIRIAAYLPIKEAT